MKKIILLFLGCVIFADSMQRPQDDSKVLLKEVANIIQSYEALNPAIVRLQQLLNIPKNAQIAENPIFMEDLILQLSKKFKNNDLARIAVLLNTPGSQLWLQIKKSQEKQKELAGQKVITNITDQLANTFSDLFVKGTENEIISFLTKHKDLINNYFEDVTPLMKAAWYNLPQVVQFLIAEGAHINARSKKRGATPLFFAINSTVSPERQKEIITLLLSSGADPNIQNNLGVSPLKLATIKNLQEVMKQLLQAGARVTIQDHNGDTPLMNALRTPEIRTNTILVLLDHTIPSDFEIKNNNNDTALTLAIKELKRNEIVQELLNNGAQITDQTLKAARSLPNNIVSKKAILKSLLEKQTDPNKLFKHPTYKGTKIL